MSGLNSCANIFSHRWKNLWELHRKQPFCPKHRVRALKNLVDAEIYRETEEISAYERQIHEQRLEKFQEFYPDLNRLINFIAIYDGYVGENRSPERFLEVITRIEREVFGGVKAEGTPDSTHAFWDTQEPA